MSCQDNLELRLSVRALLDPNRILERRDLLVNYFELGDLETIF